jgi:hypothetical protein
VHAYHLRTYRNQPDSILERLNPAGYSRDENVLVVRRGAAILEARRLNVFAQMPAQPPATTAGATDATTDATIDDINGKPPSDGAVIIDARTQPAIEIRGGAVARAVFLQIGERTFPAQHGLQRGDDSSGFYASFATRLLPSGTHHVTLLAIGTDGKAYSGQPEGVTLKIQNE